MRRQFLILLLGAATAAPGCSPRKESRPAKRQRNQQHKRNNRRPPFVMSRVEEIHKKLPNTHLVMHGSSSVPQDLQDVINAPAPGAEGRHRVRAGLIEGDLENGLVPCGQAVGLVRSIPTVGELSIIRLKQSLLRIRIGVPTILLAPFLHNRSGFLISIIIRIPK